MSDFPAGWYDDGSGVQRWWDGHGWTEDVLRDFDEGSQGRKRGFGETLQSLGERVTARRDPRGDADAIWGSVARPLAGVGGGSYKLTSDHLIVETGLFSTNRQQLRVQDIVEVSASQNMTQKLRDVGSIEVRVRSGRGVNTFLLEDIPDFRQGAALISKAASGTLKGHNPASAPNGKEYESGYADQRSTGHSRAKTGETRNQEKDRHAAAMGLNTELLRLAQLHSDGALTDEEFKAAKKKMLDL